MFELEDATLLEDKSPELKALYGLMKRTAVRFDPNHEDGDQTPHVIFDHFYETGNPVRFGIHGGRVTTRALFWLVWDCTNEAPEDGGPWCLMVPFRAWLNRNGYWQLSDRTAQRTRDLLWRNFGFVTY